MKIQSGWILEQHIALMSCLRYDDSLTSCEHSYTFHNAGISQVYLCGHACTRVKTRHCNTIFYDSVGLFKYIIKKNITYIYFIYIIIWQTCMHIYTALFVKSHIIKNIDMINICNIGPNNKWHCQVCICHFENIHNYQINDNHDNCRTALQWYVVHN